ERHGRVAEHTVELDRDTASGVAGGNVEYAPVPADARRGIVAAERLASEVHELCAVLEWQLDRPVVRQIDRSPTAVVEPRARGREQPADLVEHPALAEAEVLRRIVGVAEVEAP